MNVQQYKPRFLITIYPATQFCREIMKGLMENMERFYFYKETYVNNRVYGTMLQKTKSLFLKQ
jgi:hypothetical protein